MRMTKPFIDEGRVHVVEDAPLFQRPAYVVFPADHGSEVIDRALDGLFALWERESGDCRLVIEPPGQERRGAPDRPSG